MYLNLITDKEKLEINGVRLEHIMYLNDLELRDMVGKECVRLEHIMYLNSVEKSIAFTSIYC